MTINTSNSIDLQYQVMKSQINDYKTNKFNHLIDSKNANEEEVLKVSKQFSSIFISTLLNSVFDNIPSNSITGGGSAEKLWRSMQIQEYGKLMTERGGLGISKTIQDQLLSLQEG